MANIYFLSETQIAEMTYLSHKTSQEYNKTLKAV